MGNASSLTELRNKYIALSKHFFEQISKGKSLTELQSLQEEIERTLLQLDKEEKITKEHDN